MRLSLLVRFTAITITCAAVQVSQAQSEGLAWRADLASAQAEASQTGKLVLVHFWTESCGPCKALEQRVFSQPSVAMAVAGSYVPVKINANEAPELARKYGVTRVPTDAVVTPNGELVKAFVSPPTPMEYVGYVTQLASAYKAQSGRTYNQVAANAPAPNGNPPAPPRPAFNPTPNFAQAYAGLVGAQQPAPEQPTPELTTAAPTAPASNPYATQSAATPPPAQPPVIEPPAPVEQPPAPAPPQVAAVAPPAAPQAIELPPGSPPLGFDGYCPVALRKENRWAKGDVRYGAIHEGRTYLFTSQEAQREFLATPNTYSPMLSGVDPVVAVDQRRSIPGSREFGVEYPAAGGRFYLFSSEESLEKFWGNPDAYAQGAERVAALPAGESFIR